MRALTGYGFSLVCLLVDRRETFSESHDYDVMPVEVDPI